MNIILKFSTRELLFEKERSRYNWLVHKIAEPVFGCTHLVEVYDDVSCWPQIKLGEFHNSAFVGYLSGGSEPVLEGRKGWGGVFVEVRLDTGEHKRMTHQIENKESRNESKRTN